MSLHSTFSLPNFASYVLVHELILTSPQQKSLVISSLESHLVVLDFPFLSENFVGLYLLRSYFLKT